MAGCVDLNLTNIICIFAIFFAVKKLHGLYKKWCMEKMLEKWKNLSTHGKVILHALPRCKTLPSISPFAMKLETYLRMAEIVYELDTGNPFGPKGKTPWITYNGQHYTDSHLIIQFLNKKFSVNLNKNLNPEQMAITRACRIVMEEHFAWGSKQFRWIENYHKIPRLTKVSPFAKPFMRFQVSQLKARMDIQGIGMHTPAEIHQMTEDDLYTLSNILGRKKYFGGETPCEDDCAIFGGVSQAYWGMPPGSAFERLVNGELSNLKDYCERIKSIYWPDWESVLDKS